MSDAHTLKSKNPNTFKYRSRSISLYKSKTYNKYSQSLRDQAYDPIKYYHLFVL